MGALPNLLTCLRIVLTPVVIYALLAGRCGLALPVTLVAGLTDAADGYLARSLRVESRLGAWLDPLADKFLLISLYVSFSAAGLAPWWLAWLVLGRDVLILAMAGSGLLLARMRDFPPTIWGKLSTVVQIGASLILLGGCAGSAMLAAASPATVWVVAGATGWSGVHYVWHGIVRFRAAQQV